MKLKPFYDPVLQHWLRCESMKRRKIILIGMLIVVSVVFWWLRAPQSKQTLEKVPQITEPSLSTSSQTAPTSPIVESIERKEGVAKVQRALVTPITFHGKVIDQNDDPVPDATVNYSALDKFNAPGSQYQGKSGADGTFAITGLRAGLKYRSSKRGLIT